jgi:phosphomannomutase
MATIKFGTDGWRARIAEDFTFANVEIVTQALVDYLKTQNAVRF